MFKTAIILSIIRAVFIPVQCQDSEFGQSMEELNGMVIQAQEYFNTEIPEYSFEFKLCNTVTLSHNTAHYGHNSTTRKDELLYQGVIEACAKVGVDLSQFDNDGDGEIDNIFLLMPGLSERDGAGEDGIWPHRFFIKDCGATYSKDGKEVNSYCVSTESGGLMSLCHEYGHVLGLNDLYDTDGERSGGLAYALGGSTLMEDKLTVPPHLCAIEKEVLGTGECRILEKGHYDFSDGRYFKLVSNIPEEYYLIEKRPEGAAIYHIDKSAKNAGYSDFYRKDLTAAQRWDMNEINCRPDHQCAHLIGYFPSEGINHFGVKGCPLAISGITEDGFDVIEPVTVEATDIYQDAAIIKWKAFCNECTITISGEAPVQVSDSQCYFCHTFNGLSPMTDYDAEISAGPFKAPVHFRTKPYNPGISPYIYLSEAERTADGAFIKGTRIPLRVYNAPGAKSVVWYFNDNRISCDDQGYYSLEQDGTLRAEVSRADGSTDIIIKKIKIR